MSYRSYTVHICTACSGVEKDQHKEHSMSEPITSPDDFEKQLSPPQPIHSPWESLRRADQARRVSPRRIITFLMNFKDDMDGNNLHWNGPSSFTNYDDGSWFLFATHIANEQRT